MVSPRKNDYFNKQCPLYTDQGGILQGQLQRTMVWFLFTLILDLTQRYQDTFCVKLTPRIGRGGVWKTASAQYAMGVYSEDKRLNPPEQKLLPAIFSKPPSKRW